MKTSGPARPLCVFLLVIAATVSAPTIIRAQYISDDFYSALEWRMIGPFRAGKVNAVAGVPGNSSVYYFGADGGGVWKTTDGGRTFPAIKGPPGGHHYHALWIDPTNSQRIILPPHPAPFLSANHAQTQITSST